jgi:hypothetical protein
LIARFMLFSEAKPRPAPGPQLPSLAPGSASTVRGGSSSNRFEKKRGLQVERRPRHGNLSDDGVNEHVSSQRRCVRTGRGTRPKTTRRGRIASSFARG